MTEEEELPEPLDYYFRSHYERLDPFFKLLTPEIATSNLRGWEIRWFADGVGKAFRIYVRCKHLFKEYFYGFDEKEIDRYLTEEGIEVDPELGKERKVGFLAEDTAFKLALTCLPERIAYIFASKSKGASVLKIIHGIMPETPAEEEKPKKRFFFF